MLQAPDTRRMLPANMALHSTENLPPALLLIAIFLSARRQEISKTQRRSLENEEKRKRTKTGEPEFIEWSPYHPLSGNAECYSRVPMSSLECRGSGAREA